MSQERRQPNNDRHPPLVSAADTVEANQPPIWFDGCITRKNRYHAKQRAPSSESEYNHWLGITGELGAATYFRSKINWDTYPDYDGDPGYDFEVGGRRVEVKTVGKRHDVELRVPANRADCADYYVLAKCWNPKELVRLVGWIPRGDLLTFGHEFAGDIRVSPDYLYPFRPIELFPDDVRRVYHNGHHKQ